MKTPSPSAPFVPFSLHDANTAIRKRILPLGQLQLKVEQALNRVCAEPLNALRDKPSYDQSTRDGFALAEAPFSVTDNRPVYQLIGEIAAGATAECRLKPGQAVRIMTGAMVPEGCSRVVPFEICSDTGAQVTVADVQLSGPQFIRFRASEIEKGQQLLAAGTRLGSDHLLLLAENGYRKIPVHRQARVAVICTGSELVTASQPLRPGQKISGNGILLAALLRGCNGRCDWSITVGDTVELIVEQIRAVLAEKPDMIITTGGMGPGKFDLMEQVFACLGGSLVYNSLQIRPGKSTLFGMLDRIPFFGLPGPPPAVRILFHELVTPALDCLHGLQEGGKILFDAALSGQIHLKQTNQLQLKGGVATIVAGQLQVRPAQRLEQINAIIHFQDNPQPGQPNNLVRIHLLGPLAPYP